MRPLNAKKPSGLPEGLSVSPKARACARRKNFGPSEWPQSDDLPDYFFFFAVVFFLAGAFFLAFEALFVAFFFIAIVCLLAEISYAFWPLSSQALSSSATHHPYGSDYMGALSSGQRTNTILEIFF